MKADILLLFGDKIKISGFAGDFLLRKYKKVIELIYHGKAEKQMEAVYDKTHSS